MLSASNDETKISTCNSEETFWQLGWGRTVANGSGSDPGSTKFHEIENFKSVTCV